MTLSASQIFNLNNRMGKVAKDCNLGTVLAAAEAGAAGALPAGSVGLAELGAGVAPSHVVKYAGRFTTVGGDANEAIAVAGVLASDEVVVTLRVAGGTPRTVLTAVTAANAINVVMSGDPAADHVLTYVVYRAAV